MKFLALFFAGAVQLTTIAADERPAVYDLAASFSLAPQNNHVWTYGMLGRDGQWLSFTAPGTTSDDAGRPVRVWSNPSSGDAIFHNGLDETVISNGGDGIHPPSSVWLHPPLTSQHQYAVVRFTAPSTGRYSIRTSFRKVLRLAGNGVELSVRHNRADLFSDILQPGTEPGTFATRLKLSRGDTIDILLADAGDGTYGDSTFLAVTIASEPSKTRIAHTRVSHQSPLRPMLRLVR